MPEGQLTYTYTMDTIIYLYHSRENREFVIEKWKETEYCLIRLGIPMLLWNNLKKNQQLTAEDKMMLSQASVKESERQKKKFWSRLHKKRQGVKSNGANVSEERKAGEEAAEWMLLQRQVSVLLSELDELQIALSLLGDYPSRIFCVYEEYLLKKINTTLWWERWKLPIFREYHEEIWAEELMKYAVHEDFLILGYAPSIGQILYKNATRMRSVKWVLRLEQYTESVQQFVEEFYQEYGLVVMTEVLEEGAAWYRVRLAAAGPVNVLDFSGEEKLSVCDVVKGSIWLDMDSLEGKQRRMETRCPQICYFSLKKQWKQLQKVSCQMHE